MEEYRYITLRCKYCGKMDCELYPLGSYIRDKEGCTRRVSEDQAAQWDHITKEVIPFLAMQKNPDTEEIDDFLNEIYNCPIGNKLDKAGKVKIENKKKKER